MSAIIVPVNLIRDAEIVTGQPSFSVELANAAGEITHYGCNWESCPTDICDALRNVGCSVFPTWGEALERSGLSVKQSESFKI